MSPERTVKIRLRADVSPFIRAMHDVTWSMTNASRAFRGQGPVPVPPYPRRHGGMTARQYRAARRAYARQIRALRKADR